MAENCPNTPDRIVFFADAHLDLSPEGEHRAERVASFLRSIRGQVSHIYIVGDHFDYWFEYRHVVPSTAPRVVFELYNLAQSGVAITMFAGNHDYWLGPYIRNSVGINIITDHAAVEHQGVKLYIHHGDGLYPHDYGYRLLKKVLRNPVSIFLYRLLHPELAAWIAAKTSKTSRAYLAPPVDDTELPTRLFREIADSRLAEGYDAVVYGHSHIPLMERRPGGTLVLLGDWITHMTYVVLENGLFTMHAWKKGE
jgi:UDP-2,3-diacylglucosamine hydrolase